jgi:hypothetical protein
MTQQQIHSISIDLAQMFALSYREDPWSELTWSLLEAYRACRRELPRTANKKRFGSHEAYAATQGIN